VDAGNAMRKSKTMLLSAGRSDGRQRALGVIRPGVEAMLLAAVALGCAQGGWAILAPDTAGASSGTLPEAEPTAGATSVDVRSPFAPQSAALDSTSYEANSLLAGVQLAGVRMSDDPSRSGAVLTMSDGAQHAFSVGQDIGAGVRLIEVQDDYVLVSFAGGQRQIAMAPVVGFSFAQALMGRAQAPAESAVASLPQQDAAPVAASAPGPAASQDNLAWLASALGQVETVDGVARGWRMPAALPAAAAGAGLQAGDLIESVNGVRPGDASALLGAVSQGDVRLAVLRGAELITITIAAASPT